MSRIAAISRTSCEHHIDHLAPLCAALEAPLLTPSEKEAELAENFYPDLSVKRIPPEKFHIPFLVDSNYDVWIHSFPWPKELIEEHPLAKKKTIRRLFTPHGYSDKQDLEDTWSDYRHNDLTLVYGQRIKSILLRKKVPIVSVEMGNLRHSYYRKHRSFFDEKVEKYVLRNLPREKPTLLYAPSWKIGQASSSLYKAEKFVFQTLPRYFSVIVKLHPWQEKDNVAALYQILARYENTESVKIVEDFSCIYALLAKADLFLGDVSSTSYDCLPFKVPMFFLNTTELPEKHPALFLQRYGSKISLKNPEKEAKKMLDSLEKEDPMHTYKEILYRHVFGTYLPFEERRLRLIKQLSHLCGPLDIPKGVY